MASCASDARLALTVTRRSEECRLLHHFQLPGCRVHNVLSIFACRLIGVRIIKDHLFECLRQLQIRMPNCQVDEKKQTVASSSNGNGLKWLPKLDSNQRPAD
jgi:hypothetical protein